MNSATDSTPRKAKHRQILDALNAISTIVHGPRGAKKRAYIEGKSQRKDSHKAKLLALLTAPTEPLKLRTALLKAVVAVRCGATAEELQACTALQALAEWSKLAEPLTAFATAKGIDPTTLLAGLGIAAQEPAEAPSPPVETAPAAEAPKATTEPKPAHKPSKHHKARN